MASLLPKYITWVCTHLHIFFPSLHSTWSERRKKNFKGAECLLVTAAIATHMEEGRRSVCHPPSARTRSHPWHVSHTRADKWQCPLINNPYLVWEEEGVLGQTHFKGKEAAKRRGVKLVFRYSGVFVLPLYTDYNYKTLQRLMCISSDQSLI